MNLVIGGQLKKKKKDIEGTVYKGSIDCSGCKLTSLKGCPNEITRDFNCNLNELTSLEGGPKEVYGDFNCKDNDELNLLRGTRVRGKIYY